MKINLQNILAITLIPLSTTSIIKSDALQNNRTAYELTALAADGYMNYHYGKGAGAGHCSPNGTRLCKIFTHLKQKIRLFKNPSRPDLQELSENTALAFRDFDLSGSSNDRITVANGLINLLQATLPLLSGKEDAECRTLIHQLKTTLQ